MFRSNLGCRNFFRVLLLAICGGRVMGGFALLSAAEPAPRKPNIVFVMADDLGYGDLGCFGQKIIRTPNIDALAADGMKFTQHYANAVCAPARCILMTGKHSGHTFVGDNREAKSEGQFPIPAETVTVAKLLKAQGYATGAFGKWGLGGPMSSGDPMNQGFDRFFGYNCQRVAHNYYPDHLWDNQQRKDLSNALFSAHQKLPEGADKTKRETYDRYRGKEYAPDLIMEQARQFVKDHSREPFFLYVPTTVPHLALQVPEDSAAEYYGKFDDPPYDGHNAYLPNFTPRATYAGMITRLDREVGRLVDLLKELKLEDDTIFVFTSDNGPLYDQLGGTDSDFFHSAGGLRGKKGSLYEGGFRVPLVVRWHGKIKPGTTSDRVTGLEDWLPTLLDVCGANSAVPHDVDGISFLPTLLGQAQAERPFLYREFPSYGGQQMLREGDWVAVRQKLIPAGKQGKTDLNTELYNLKDDPSQEHNLAKQQPARLAAMEKRMQSEHTPSADFPFPALDGQASK